MAGGGPADGEGEGKGEEEKKKSSAEQFELWEIGPPGPVPDSPPEEEPVRPKKRRLWRPVQKCNMRKQTRRAQPNTNQKQQETQGDGQRMNRELTIMIHV
jgi:hypothetical protein